MMARFPRSSVIFLYRQLTDSVTSFMRVMAAFKRLAALFTARNTEIMDWWCQVQWRSSVISRFGIFLPFQLRSLLWQYCHTSKAFSWAIL